MADALGRFPAPAPDKPMGPSTTAPAPDPSFTPSVHQYDAGPDQDVGTPKSFLRTLPRNRYNENGILKQLGADQIDGLEDNFAMSLAPYMKAVQGMGYHPEFTAGAEITGHNKGSLHYTGDAADFVVTDGKGNVIDPRSAKGLSDKLSGLANQHGVSLLDEYAHSSAAASGGHFHLQSMQPNGTPGNIGPKSVSKLQDTAAGMAKLYGIDKPEIFQDLIHQESRWKPNAKSTAGAYGLGQIMPANVPGVMKAIGGTSEDYYNNPNVQLKASAYMFSQLLKQYGNYPQALAAYNAGSGGVDHFQSTGHVDYPETRNYVATILGISPAQASQEVVSPSSKFSYDPGLAQKNIDTKEQTSQANLFNQVLRNGAPFVNSLVGAPIIQAIAGDNALNPDFVFPFSKLPGTANDDEWASDHFRTVSKMTTFGLSTLIPLMHPTGQFDDYLKGYHTTFMDLFNPTKWGEGEIQNRVMGFGDLATSALMAEVVMPAVGARFMGPAWETFKGTSLGAKVAGGSAGLADWLTTNADKLPKVTQGIVKYLAASLPGNTEATMLGSALNWAGAMGATNFNVELGDQIAKGTPLMEAIPLAFAAGQQGASQGLAASIIIPMGLSAAGAFGRGVIGGIAPGLIDFIFTKMPAVAEAASKTWASTPQSVRNVMTAPMTAMIGAMDAVEREGFGKVVWQAFKDNLNEGNKSYAASQAIQMSKTVDSVSQRFSQGASSLQHVLASAEGEVVRAQAGIKQATQLVQQAEATVGVQTWKAASQVEQQIQAEIGKQQAALKGLKPDDPLRIDIEKDLKSLKKDQLPQATAKRVALEGTNSDVMKWNDAKTLATKSQNDLMAAQQNPAWINKDKMQKQQSYMTVLSENLQNYKEQVGEWAKNRTDKPELSKSITLDPVHTTPGYGTLNKEQQATVALLDDAVRRRISASAESRMPLIERELMQTATMAFRTGMSGKGIVDVGCISQSMDVFSQGVEALKMVDKDAAKKLEQEVLRPLKGIVTSLKELPGNAVPAQIADTMKKGWDAIWEAKVPALQLLESDPTHLISSDPATAKLTKDALWNASQTMLTENLLPAQLQQRLMQDAIAHLKGIGSADAANMASAQSSPADVAFKRYMAEAPLFKRGMDEYYRIANNRLDRPDKIWADSVHGGTMAVFSDALGVAKSAHDVGTHLSKNLDADLREALGVKSKTAELPPDKMTVIAKALESSNPSAYKDLFNQHPELFKPLSGFMSAMSYLERFKLVSPEMKDYMRDSYLMHRYNRLTEFRRGIDFTSDSQARGLANVVRMASEKARTIGSLEEAEKMALDAENQIKTSTGMTWREFSQIATDEGRAKKLFGTHDPTRDQIRDASEVLSNALLGEPEKNLPALIHGQINSVFKADAVRHMLVQMRHMTDENGTPYLISMKDHINVPTTSAREPGTFGAVKSGVKFVPLDNVPGMTGAKIFENGQELPSSNWMVHPQAAQYMNLYGSYSAAKGEGIFNDLSKVGNLLRAGSLVSGAVPHLWNIMSNMFLLTNGNIAAALGLRRLGQEALTNTPELVTDFIRHGLDPTNLLEQTKRITSALLPQGSETGAKIFGQTAEGQQYQNKLMNMVSQGVIQPLERYIGASGYLNRATMFNAIMEAQVGAAMYKTKILWDKMGPKLMQEYGGDYGAAYSAVKKLAMQEANTAAGVVSTHFVSQTVSNAAYRYLLTPQFTMNRARLAMSAIDGAVQTFGGRSMFAHIQDPMLRQAAQAQMANMLAGGMIAGAVYTDIMSIALNGRDTSTNPTDKPNHVLLSSDPEGGETYLLNPFFGMFKPFFGTLRSIGAIHRDTGDMDLKPVLHTIQGLLNPALTTAMQTVQGQDSSGAPISTDVSGPAAGRWMQNFAYHFNNPALTGVTNIPEPGTELTPAERLFAALGVSTIKRITGLKDASLVEAQIRPYDTQLNQQIDNLLTKSKNAGGYATDQGDEFIQQAQELAFRKGIPVGNPLIRSLFKDSGINEEGNYVYTSEASFQARLEKFFAPLASAGSKVPTYAQPYLYGEIQQRQEGAVPRPGSLRGSLGGEQQ